MLPDTFYKIHYFVIMGITNTRIIHCSNGIAMMETYKVYPNGLRKLDRAGITTRIETLRQEELKKYRMSAVSLDDIRRAVGRMEGEGHLRNMEKNERNEYKQFLYRAAREEDFYWTTNRKGGKLKERAVAEDFYLLSGVRNLAVLHDNELFDYKKFNFDSIFEFTGTVGSALEIVSKANGWRYGLPWNTRRENKRTISSIVTSDGAGEMRIFQQDITPYETTDPFGKRVYYRRLGITDKKAVEASSSTESYLLISILKYVEQLGLRPDILEKGAVTTNQYITNISQMEMAKQHKIADRASESIKALFSTWEIPLPKVSEGKVKDSKFAHFIQSTLGGGYNICISENNELVIGRKIRNEIDVENSVTFLPEDTNNLIKSLLYQAARGLGRTTERQLLDILEYRYSSKMKDGYKLVARK